MKNTAPTNKTVTYTTRTQPAVQEYTSRKRGLCKRDFPTSSKRSRWEVESAGCPPFNLKEEDFLDETASAATTFLFKVAMEAMAVVLKAMTSFCAVYDEDITVVMVTTPRDMADLVEFGR